MRIENSGLEKPTAFRGVTFLKRYKMLSLSKFNKAWDPTANVVSFRMFALALGLEPRTQPCCSQSLEGMTVTWNHLIDPKIGHKWNEFTTTFMKHFSYKTTIHAPSLDLECLTQKDYKSSMVFVDQWLNKAASMIDQPSEEEQIQIIAMNLLHHYREWMLCLLMIPDLQTLQQINVKSRRHSYTDICPKLDVGKRMYFAITCFPRLATGHNSIQFWHQDGHGSLKVFRPQEVNVSSLERA